MKQSKGDKSMVGFYVNVKRKKNVIMYKRYRKV